MFSLICNEYLKGEPTKKSVIKFGICPTPRNVFKAISSKGVFRTFFHDIPDLFWVKEVREAVKNYLADFYAQLFPPAFPTPLAENHFAKKT